MWNTTVTVKLTFRSFVNGKRTITNSNFNGQERGRLVNPCRQLMHRFFVLTFLVASFGWQSLTSVHLLWIVWSSQQVQARGNCFLLLFLLYIHNSSFFILISLHILSRYASCLDLYRYVSKNHEKRILKFMYQEFYM